MKTAARSPVERGFGPAASLLPFGGINPSKSALLDDVGR